MLDRLWKLLVGYVTIQAEGMMLERFINACESARIPLTAVRRASRLRMTAHICAHHQRRLWHIARDMRCEITALSYHGPYALIRRLVHRPVLLFGLCAALFFGVMSTQFVLDVRVVGVEGDRAQKILQIAEQYGAKRGAIWAKLDQADLQRELEIQADFAQKVLVHKRGVVMEIEIIPFLEGPPLFKKGEVCDIVANQNAVVDSIIALEGTPIVSAGDVVRCGDVLIRGTFMRNIDEGKQRFVQARGIVLGRIAYMGTAKVSLCVQVPEKTGQTETVRFFTLANWTIPLTDGTSFSDSVLVNQSDTAVIGSVLPAYVTTKTYAEVRTVTKEQTYAQAEAAAIAYAKADAMAKMPKGIAFARQTVYSELTQDSLVEVRVYLTAVVAIGMENRQMMTEPLLYIPKWW